MSQPTANRPGQFVSGQAANRQAPHWFPIGLVVGVVCTVLAMWAWAWLDTNWWVEDDEALGRKFEYGDCATLVEAIYGETYDGPVRTSRDEFRRRRRLN